MTASVPLYVFLSRHAFTKRVFGVIVTLKNETQDLMVLFCIIIPSTLSRHPWLKCSPKP